MACEPLRRLAAVVRPCRCQSAPSSGRRRRAAHDVPVHRQRASLHSTTPAAAHRRHRRPRGVSLRRTAQASRGRGSSPPARPCGSSLAHRRHRLQLEAKPKKQAAAASKHGDGSGSADGARQADSRRQHVGKDYGRRGAQHEEATRSAVRAASRTPDGEGGSARGVEDGKAGDDVNGRHRRNYRQWSAPSPPLPPGTQQEPPLLLGAVICCDFGAVVQSLVALPSFLAEDLELFCWNSETCLLWSKHTDCSTK